MTFVVTLVADRGLRLADMRCRFGLLAAARLAPRAAGRTSRASYEKVAEGYEVIVGGHSVGIVRDVSGGGRPRWVIEVPEMAPDCRQRGRDYFNAIIDAFVQVDAHFGENARARRLEEGVLVATGDDVGSSNIF